MTLWYKIRYPKEIYYDIRAICQKIFRPDHVSDREVWGAFFYFIKKMYPLFLRYKNLERQGTPFLEGFEGPNYKDDPDDYDWEAMHKRWEEILEEILFAFEWGLIEDKKYGKRLTRKIKRQYGDWEAKTEKNRHITWFGSEKKLPKEAKEALMKSSMTEEERLLLKKELGEEVYENASFFYDTDLYMKLDLKAQQGMKLFGEHMYSLWD
jgi:hypothetical protein